MPNLTSAQIFVVDDEVANVRLMTRILESEGYTSVRAFTDSAAALAAASLFCPDLVLLDLHMPHVDGLDFLASLRAHAEDEFVPVLMVTGDVTRTALRSALERGANEFVTKPIDADEMLLRVRNLLSIRRAYQELRDTNAELAEELRVRTRDDDDVAADREHRADVIRAIAARGGPAMVFQPIVELASGAAVGVEALARFGSEPDRGPDAWFADAAALGLGTELELSAIESALRHLSELDPSLIVAVNVSAATMLEPAFRARLSSWPLSRMSFEVTEHQPVDDYDPLAEVTAELRDRGALVCVDDAGAGYASLRHILQLHPNVIKLDLTLVRDIDSDPVKRALASALTRFASELGAALTAEGIETASELATVRALGVDFGQGYFIAQPGAAKSVCQANALVAAQTG
jgi:EAL domain-containing protein (putative c-di-GMP-specific phosphodiesterase class I)/FixJ family two-component response regulator